MGRPRRPTRPVADPPAARRPPRYLPERTGLYDQVQARLYPRRRYHTLTSAERRAVTTEAVRLATMGPAMAGWTPADLARRAEQRDGQGRGHRRRTAA